MRVRLSETRQIAWSLAPPQQQRAPVATALPTCGRQQAVAVVGEVARLGRLLCHIYTQDNSNRKCYFSSNEYVRLSSSSSASSPLSSSSVVIMSVGRTGTGGGASAVSEGRWGTGGGGRDVGIFEALRCGATGTANFQI